MKKVYNIHTLDQLIMTATNIKTENNVIVNIENDIFVSKSIEFSECNNIEITSSNGAAIIGGIINPSWKKEDEYLTFNTETEPRMLIINGKPAQKTCFPADDYLANTDVCDYIWINSRNGGWDKTPSLYDLTHLTTNPKDIPETLDIKNCDIRVIHQWDESTVSVKGFDKISGIIETASEMAHPAGAFGVQKYQFVNTSYGDPQKGRWFYDKSAKKICYCPKNGETAENISCMIPQADSLFVIKNCKNINISNLKFALSNSPSGVISGLRAINPVGALQVENSENITLDKLDVSFSGGQGIKVSKSKNIKIINSTIENCASCGIATYECEDEYIGHNVINNIGLVDFSAVSIHAGGKSELLFVLDGLKEEHGQTVIDSNIIDGSPYCGITCNGGPHIIENNKVTRCMQILKDGGAVYCSRAEGTLIKDNYISEVPSDTAYAFYLDELSENCILDGNVSINVNIPFNAHIAEKCTLQNNIFINDEDTDIRLARSTNFRFINNLIKCTGKLTVCIKSYMPDENFALKDCASFEGNIIAADSIVTDVGEETNLTLSPNLDMSIENYTLSVSNLPENICNKYLITK